MNIFAVQNVSALKFKNGIYAYTLNMSVWICAYDHDCGGEIKGGLTLHYLSYSSLCFENLTVHEAVL